MRAETPIPDRDGPAQVAAAPLGPRRSAPDPVSASGAGFDAADEIAPVDRQADPSHWLPGRALLVVGAVAALALVVTVVVCLLIWITAPMHPLQVPIVGRA
jgi:hypothetical protein